MSDQKKIEQFISHCRSVGLNVTPQRLAVYKAIMNDSTHPNPETIYKRVKAENPTISFATVYKTLEAFEQNGIVSMVTTLHNTVRYDPIVQQHHHLVCVRCKKVIDLNDEALNNLSIPEDALKGSQLLNYSILVNILCEECRAKQ
jgi:Fur family peroxide stress response transcriptional regulator